MKILFVGQNLETGGIQKSLLNILKMLSEDESMKIDLFTFAGGDLSSELPKNIKVIYGTKLLKLISTPFSKVIDSKIITDIMIRILLMVVVRIVGSKKLYDYLFKLQREFKDYDVAVSYFNDVPDAYFNQGTNQFVIHNVYSNKKMAWIHTDPIKAGFNYNYCKEIYGEFNTIICVSKACASKFKEFLPDYTNKTDIVYNVFLVSSIIEKATQYIPFKKRDEINIVTVARVDNGTKRIDRIIDVCKKLKENKIDNFVWRIVGEGPDMRINKIKIKEYGLDDNIKLVGNKKNPYPFIKHSDFFVLTSEFEGYPMVIGESLILNTPIITTEYAAVGEQIDEGINGLITKKTTEDIYLKVKYILENNDFLKEMKSKDKVLLTTKLLIK